MEKAQYDIEIIGVNKNFKTYYDKATSLKERFIRLGNKNKEIKTILSNINIKIKKGESVGLIGVNGCGKSTLLKLISKIIYPTSGKIKVNGKLSSLLELGAGFHVDFTGLENIYFNASIFGLSKTEINKRIDDIISFSELQDFLYQPVRTYSSGMYMRLAFSIAINVNSDIILLDEILSVGDEEFQRKCYDKIIDLKRKKTTMIIVSHDMEALAEVCDRVIWLKDNCVYMDGECQKVIESYKNSFKGDKYE